MQGFFKKILLTLLSWLEKLEYQQNDQTNVSFGQTNVTYVSAKKPRLHCSQGKQILDYRIFFLAEIMKQIPFGCK